VRFFPLPISLHGLRAQVLLWTVLPLIIFLIVFSLSGVTSHQNSMHTLAAEENSRLVLALAEVVALQAENDALRNGIPIAQVRAGVLELASVVQMDHEHAVST